MKYAHTIFRKAILLVAQDVENAKKGWKKTFLCSTIVS